MEAKTQMPVYKESHHKTIFDNQYVRVLDLNLAPGDTTAWHTHFEASVVVFLTTSKIAIQNHGKPPVITDAVPGNTVYRNYDEEPVFHTVWVEDTSLFRCFVVEIKKDKPLIHQTGVASLENAKLLFHKDLVDAFSLQIDGKEEVSLPKTNHPCILISFEGSGQIDLDNKSTLLHTDQFLFIQADKSVKISGVDGHPFSCILLRIL